MAREEGRERERPLPASHVFYIARALALTTVNSEIFSVQSQQGARIPYQTKPVLKPVSFDHKCGWQLPERTRRGLGLARVCPFPIVFLLPC